jgi:hypothetical protein
MTKARDLANGGFGLVLVKPSSVVGGTDNGKGTVSFSGVGTSGISLNNVFSSTYDNYRINISITVSSSGSLNIRLRASGSDNTTSNSYVRQILDAYTTTVGTSRATSTTWDIGGTSSTLINGYFVDLISPFKATATGYTSQAIRADSGGYLNPSTGTHNQTVSYDGITIYPSTGTFTGTISVYGYNN